MNLIDNWKGYYEYGEGYSLPQFGERVTIYVNLQGNNENFIGTLREETSEHSVPLEATIKGFSEDNFISFIKKYPKFPTLQKLGSSNIVMESGQLEIEHAGFIDVEYDSIYGSWTITDKDDHENIVYGTWLLKRVK